MADILSIGSSGLSAYRKSLEVTGNNIVNANTEGYSRRDVQLNGVGEASMTPTSLNNGSGGGVAVDLIRRATDDFVQSESRQATSAASQASALSDRLDRLEKNLFSSDTDLGTSIQDFFNKIQDFASTPTSLPVRVTVLQATDSLASDFRAQADKLNQESAAVLTDASSQIVATNALTAQLAEINKKLDSLGKEPTKTNDLLDQRDKIIDQIVKEVNVTVETRPSGAANLYLGDGTGGPQLVNANGAKELSISRNSGNLSVTLDPYGTNTPIGSINGGTIGGILAFNDHVAAGLDQLNRLATGIATTVNAIHVQGIDLQGRKGLPLFSTDNLAVVPSKTNHGTGAATLDISNADSLGSGGYSARFDATSNNWVVTNDVTKAQASGSRSVTIDGLKISFSGTPANGDTFTFAPLADAAAGIHILLQDPNQLAASLPQLAQNGGTNTGSATITLNSSLGVVPPPELTSLSTIFSHALSPSAALGINRDGAVASIPAGATNITLSSLANISAATFQFDAQQLIQRTPVQLSLTVNSTPVTLSLFSGDQLQSANITQDPLTRVTDEVNRALDEAGLSDQLFASTANGNMVINALGSNQLSTAGLRNTETASDKKFAATVTMETAAPAADIEILTTEGQQLTGAGLSPTDVTNLLKTSNGFSTEAYYTPIVANLINGTPATALTFAAGDVTINAHPIEASASVSELVANINKDQSDVTAVLNGDNTISLRDKLGNPIFVGGNAPAGAGLTAGGFSGSTYRGITVTSSTSRLPQPTVTANADNQQTARLNLGVVPETDSPWQTPTGAPQAGAVYSVAIDGLKAIRLAGDAIAGKDSAAIATALADKISALVPQRTISGSTFSLPDNGLVNAHFTLRLDNKDYAVTFHRATDGDGRLQQVGTFSVEGNPDIKVTLNDGPSTDNPPTKFVSIALPKTASATAPSISLSGPDAATFGLSTLTQNLIASRPAAAGSDPQDLNLIVAGRAATITVTGNSGSSQGVSWSTNGNGQLVLSAAFSSPALAFASTTTLARDAAAKLGFLGTDLTVSHDNGTLSVTSAVTDRLTSQALVDTSASVSRIGKSVTIAGPVPEDLILATKAATGGIRRLTAKFPTNLVRTNPQLPDVNIRVTAPGHVEITDRATGSVLATRAFSDSQPVEYMGSNFQINGNVVVGDTFTVTTDLGRTGDNRNGLKLASLQKQDLFGPNSGTFQDIYASAVSKIGASAQAAQTAATSSKVVADNLKAAFTTATGVDMDTEAANLLQMQQAYQACAQIISTARDMFASILKAF